jgi:hypothetical protein
MINLITMVPHRDGKTHPLSDKLRDIRVPGQRTREERAGMARTASKSSQNMPSRIRDIRNR